VVRALVGTGRLVVVGAGRAVVEGAGRAVVEGAGPVLVGRGPEVVVVTPGCRMTVVALVVEEVAAGRLTACGARLWPLLRCGAATGRAGLGGKTRLLLSGCRLGTVVDVDVVVGMRWRTATGGFGTVVPMAKARVANALASEPIVPVLVTWPSATSAK